MNLYREEILDHYKNPRNFGELRDASVKAEKINLSCGDEIEIFVKLGCRKGSLVIEDVRHKARGCALSVAAASMLTEEIKGKRKGIVGKLSLTFMQRLLGIKVSSGRQYCVMLAVEALEKAMGIKRG